MGGEHNAVLVEKNVPGHAVWVRSQMAPFATLCVCVPRQLCSRRQCVSSVYSVRSDFSHRRSFMKACFYPHYIQAVQGAQELREPTHLLPGALYLSQLRRWQRHSTIFVSRSLPLKLLVNLNCLTCRVCFWMCRGKTKRREQAPSGLLASGLWPAFRRTTRDK